MNATAQASRAPTTGPKLDNRRVLAALVDLAIVVAGSVVILVAADALSGDSGDVRGALSAVVLGWALYYYFALESGEGQTVGKKLLKLRVVRADGRPAGLREIAVRTVLRVVDGVGGYIVGLIVMLATGQRRQRLGDLAAGTIVVDASAPAYAPSAPVVEPVEEASVEDALVEGEPIEDEEPEVASSTGTPTITLPSRPTPPPTLHDLAAAAAPPVPEMRPFDPPLVEDEPVEDEPVEDEPVEDEPVAEFVEPLVEHEPVAEADAVAVPAVEVAAPVEDLVEDVALEDEPAAEEPLPDFSTPSLEELAHDVVAARAEPVPGVGADVEHEPVEEEPVEDESDEDEPMTVKSVETVSAIDLVMGGAPEEDDSSEQDQHPEGPAAS